MLPSHSGPIRPRRERGLAPCSSAQRRLWFLQQLVPSSGPAYNIAVSFRVTGPLDAAALTAAVRALMDRHESLRTSIVTRGGEPWQHVAGALEPPVRVVSCGPPERLHQLLRAELSRVFDPEVAPLFRVLVAAVGPDDHAVALSASHLICDGFSLGLFFDELEILYAAQRHGRQLDLAPLPLQYADFAVWERARYKDPAVAAELAQWVKELADLPESAPRPDWPRPPMQRFRGRRWRTEIPAPVADAVTAATHRLAATRSMIYLAAFQVLLARYTGSREAVVGMPFAGRSRTELEPIIGLFAAAMPVRLNLSGDPTGAEVVAAAKAATQRALGHQHLRFEELVERLQGRRDTGRNPVFQCLFAYQNAPDRGLRLAGLHAEPLRIDLGTAAFDVKLELFESAAGTRCVIEYNTDLFRATTIERLVTHYISVLRWLLREDRPRISRLSLTTPQERDRVRRVFNNTAVAPAGPATLDAMLAVQAGQTPLAPCLTAAGRSLCYREMWQRAGELAWLLRDRGARADSVVAVCLERSLAQVVALAGVIAAGAAYLPLDPGHPQERLRLIVEQATPVAVVTNAAIAAGLTVAADAEIICMDELGRDGPSAGLPAARTWPPPRPDNLAYLIFTSGSTGLPKGVMITHRAIVNRLRWMQDSYRLAPEDRILQKTPFTFDVSVWEYFWPLTVGAQLIVAAPGVHRDPLALAQTMRRHGVTVAHFVPAMLAEFVAAGPPELPDLHTLFSSGEELPHDLVRRVLDRFDVRLHNLYGPTEAAVDVTYHQCGKTPQAASVPIGRPVANTTIHVLDDQLEPVPIGVPGELYVGGAQLTRGYRGRPGVTAASLVPAPQPDISGERLYRTGDLGRWLDSGELEFLGRADGQVKIRGHRVELGEIECALRLHPDVATAAAAVRDMEGRPPALVGYLTLTRTRSRSSAGTGGTGGPAEAQLHARIERELREMLAHRLPPAMIPAFFCFLDSLPVLSSGKVDRRRLPDPEALGPRPSAAGRPPRTDAERTVAEVWGDLLRVDRVGVTDDFFALGGDSILAVQAVARLDERRLAVPLQAFFEQPTVERIAAAATRLPARDPSAREQLHLTRVQASLLDPLARQAGPCVIRSGWRPSQPRGRLERALRALIRAQPALRLRVVTQDGMAFQYLADPDEQAGALPRIRWIAPGTAEGAETEDTAEAAAVPGPGGLLLTVVERPGEGVQDLIISVDPLLVCTDSLHLIGVAFDRVLGGNAPSSHADDGAFRESLASLCAPYADNGGSVPSPLRLTSPARNRPVFLRGCATMSTAVRRRLIAEASGRYRCTVIDILTTALAGALRALRPASGSRAADVQFADPAWPRQLAGPADLRLRVTVDAATPSIALLRSVKSQIRAGRLSAKAGSTHENPAPTLLRVRDMRGRGAAGAGDWQKSHGDWQESHEEPDQLFAGYGAVFLIDLTDDAGTVTVRCRPDVAADPSAVAEAYVQGAAAIADALCDGHADLYLPSDFPAVALPTAALSWLSARYPRLDDVYPLTPIQRQAVTRIAGHPRDGLYTISVTFAQTGQRFDLAAFRRTWRVLAGRHAALRTTFARLPEVGWMQAVHTDPEMPISYADLSRLPCEEQQEKVAALQREACRHRFDLEMAPQWQMSVLRLADDDYRVVCRLSYALQDGWSFSVLQEEWFDLYEAARSGHDMELPATCPLRDHVEWLSRQNMATAHEYWRCALADLRGTGQMLRIPAKMRHPGPPDPSGDSDLRYPSRGLKLDRVLQQRLQAYGRANRITFFTLIEAGWAMTLSQLTGLPRVAFGTVSAGRSPQVPGVERIYGPVNNILPIIVTVPDEARGDEWLHKLQHEHATARQYDYASVCDIGRWIGAEPGDPLVDSFVTFENFPQRPGLEQQMRDWHPDGGETQTEHALRLLLWPTTPMTIYASYYREHFDGPAVEQILQRFVRNLAGLVTSAGGS